MLLFPERIQERERKEKVNEKRLGEKGINSSLARVPYPWLSSENDYV